MRPNHLDTIARSLAAPRSRRAALVTAIAGALGLLGVPAPHEAAAHDALKKCKKLTDKTRRRRCIKKGKAHNATHNEPPLGCTPSCGGKSCGPDGCDGSCGSCGGGNTCVAGSCLPPLADASCPGPGNSTSTGVMRFAQTFQALHSGLLTKAEIRLRANTDGADFVVEIRKTDAVGVPTGIVLATSSVDDVPFTDIVSDPPRTITAIFATPASVEAGHRYALTLTRGVGQAFTIETHNNNPCLGGNLFADVSASGNFGPLPSSDMVYATFVAV